MRDAMLRYSRDVAFAAAEVYARAAEMRGAWDARLEALVVDAVLRGEADEAVRSRASALGWQASHGISVVLGRTPDGADEAGDARRVRRGRRAAPLARARSAPTRCAPCRATGWSSSSAGWRISTRPAASIAEHFGPGPIVMGPMVTDLLAAARSARAAIAGLRAAPGWPGAPRPVAADDLLPERALSGDGHAGTGW